MRIIIEISLNYDMITLSYNKNLGQ